MVFFSFAFALIIKIYPVSRKDQFFWLTTPSLYFMMAPYTEALFCLLMALTFYGIALNKKWIASIALFLAAFCRPTAIFVIPAFLLMAMLKDDKRNLGKSLKETFVYYILPTLVSSALFTFYQYKISGVWFPYYKGQAKYLGHKFSIPTLPFADCYGGMRITWLDGLAMVPGFLCIILVIAKLYQWLRQGSRASDQVWLMTLGYMPMILLTMIFCNPTWGSSTTNLFSIHRYMFCSPFFFVLLYHTTIRHQKYSTKDFALVFVLCNLLWLTMGSYAHITTLIFYNFLTLVVMGYMTYANNKDSWVTLALCSVNVFLQISLFQQYMGGLFTE
jgi:Gpi18-like mannosyltransferase